MTVREALQDIYERHGVLTSAIVLEEATSAANPAGVFLHGMFEWDDEEAARLQRLRRAQDLIRSVRVTYAEPTEYEQPRFGRAYINVPVQDGRAYVAVEDVIQDPFLRLLTIRQMERDWFALKRRYEGFVEFQEMILDDLGGDDDEEAAG